MIFLQACLQTRSQPTLEPNPKPPRWQKLEDQIVKHELGNLHQKQNEIFYQIKELTKYSKSNIPLKIGPYYYYLLEENNQHNPIICRKLNSLSNHQEIIFDLNLFSQNFNQAKLGLIRPSPDHKLLALTIDKYADENYSLVIKDLSSKEFLDFKVDAVHDIEWHNSAEKIFYSISDQNKRVYAIFEQNLITNKKTLVYQEKDPEFWISFKKSRDQKYLIISSIKSANQKILFYDLELKNLSAKKPTEWPQDFEQGSEIFNDYIVKFPEVNNGNTKLSVINKKTKQTDFVELPENPAFIIKHANPDYFAQNYIFEVSSFKEISKVYSYNFLDKSLTLLHQSKLPLVDFDPNQYETQTLIVKSSDGYNFPINLIKKSAYKNIPTPTLIYIYASYGISSWPKFTPEIVPLLDRGFTFAIAHLRGGGELGRQMQLAGTKLNKKNSINDLIAASESLVKLNIAQKNNIFAWSKSAGGAIVAAAINQRPEIFKAVILDAPFVNVLKAMQNPNLALTTQEYAEWGNPNIARELDYLKSWCPHQNIKKQAYPPILVSLGLKDTIVPYQDTIEWANKIRENNTSNNPIIIKIDPEAAHSASSGLFGYYNDFALKAAWMLALSFN